MNSCQIGQRVQCIVEKVYSFGVFVRLENNGLEGYIRKKDFDWDRLKQTSELVQPGDVLQAEIVELPTKSHQKIRLSRLSILGDPWEAFIASHRIGDVVEGIVYGFEDRGVLMQLEGKVKGYIGFDELKGVNKLHKAEAIWPEDVVEGIIISFDASRKRVNISIQKRIKQLQRASTLMNSFNTTRERPENIFSYKKWGKQLFILEDSLRMLSYLEERLRTKGFEVVALSSLDEARSQIERRCDDIFLLDLNVQTETSLELMYMIRQLCSPARMIVMSDADSLQKYAKELTALGINATIKKPLKWDKLDQLLELTVAGKLDDTLETQTCEKPDGDVQKDSLYLVEGLTKEEWNLGVHLGKELQRIVKITGAKSGFIFFRHPVKKRFHILAEGGAPRINRDAIPKLTHSPVNDVIESGGVVFEREMPDRLLGRFEKLLELLTFESCIGVPIESQGQRSHALFLFHTAPHAFSRYHVRDAKAMALLLSALLEQNALQEQVRSLGPLLLSGQMASSLAHELSNKSQAFELVSSKVNYEVKELLKGLPNEAIDNQQRNHLISTLEELSQMSADIKGTVTLFQKLKYAPQQELFSAAEVIEEAYRFLKTEFHRNHVHFHWVPPRNVYFVAGRRLWFYQALLNILLNAVQQMASLPRNRIREISVTLNPTTNYHFQIRISDTGPGIHKRLWKKVFLFGFTTRPNGSGLGLYIARDLIQSMHGKISVEKSAIGVGTTFLIELPYRRK